MIAAWADFSLGRSKEGLLLVDYVLSLQADVPLTLYIKSMLLIDLDRITEGQELLKLLETYTAQGRNHWHRN